MRASSVHPTAEVARDATVGAGTSIWQLVHVREAVVIGEECVIGRGVYVGPGVHIGDRTKIQNSALIYDPAVIGSGVFIGPAVTLTNDLYPRAVDPDGSLKRADGWTADGVTVGDGASIGAASVVLAGVSIGAWALVGAGSTVIRDVADHALVVGNPARRVGWVGRTGERLVELPTGVLRCEATGDTFEDLGESIRPIVA